MPVEEGAGETDDGAAVAPVVAGAPRTVGATGCAGVGVGRAPETGGIQRLCAINFLSIGEMML